MDGWKSQFTFNGGRSFTVVENGQLADHFTRRHGAEKFAFSRHFHFALCRICVATQDNQTRDKERKQKDIKSGKKQNKKTRGDINRETIVA